MSRNEPAGSIFQEYASLIMTMNNSFEFTLLENGLDFILSSVGHTAGAEHLYTFGHEVPSALKYAVLHLAAGVELVFKERLRRKHWSLVFKHSHKANRIAYESGKFESVGLESCLRRLREACNVGLPDEHLVRLRDLRNKRNRWEHFGAIDTPAAVIVSSVKVLEVIMEFIVFHLEPESPQGHSAQLLKDIRRGIGHLDTYIALRRQTIKPLLEAETATVASCPHCMQEALILDGGAVCRFCGYRAQGPNAAREYASEWLGLRRLKDGDAAWPISECLKCHGDACVDGGSKGHSNMRIRYVCFNCGATRPQTEVEA